MGPRPCRRSAAHPDERGTGPAGEIDGDATLYVICHAGGRSLKVSHYLARNGFEPTNVNGGMLAWAGSGRPVVTDDGAPGAI